MRKITLEPVDNGLIKTVYDDNYDGAGKIMDEKKIYILDDNVTSSYKFLIDLIDELGLFIGNDYDKDTLSIERSFGPKYDLDSKEVMNERKKLTHRLNELKKINFQQNYEVNEREKINS